MYEYDSDEELYFSWYLIELKEKSIIKDWQYHPDPFILCNRFVRTYDKIVQIKTKTRTITKDSVILNDHTYRADFLIHWYPEYADHIFMNLDNDVYHKDSPFLAQGARNFTVIDVKGSFARPHNNSAVTFPLNQKWVWQVYKIYVQKIIPQQLFKETFTPSKYLLTDKSGRARKIGFKTMSLNQYLESIKE